jgi:hypothetical protein
VPRLPFILTVGGVPVTPAFVGVPSWSVGVTQVNFAVPANVPQGRQPVAVTVGGVSSATAYLNVTGAAGNVQLIFTPSSVNQSPSDGGWHYEAQLTETNGLGINITNLTVFGNDYTDKLTEWFGSTRIPAFGTLAGYFIATCSCTPPWDGTWQVSGTDDNGNSNTWSGVVHFLPPSTSSVLPSVRRPESVERSDAALDTIPAGERLYPAWEGAIPSAASAPFHLFDLLSVSGVTPPTHPEGARNAKAAEAPRP